MTLDYARHLWMEKEIKSVANVTGEDVRSFIGLADQMSMKPETEPYPFLEANSALTDLRNKRIRGAKVLVL